MHLILAIIPSPPLFHSYYKDTTIRAGKKEEKGIIREYRENVLILLTSMHKCAILLITIINKRRKGEFFDWHPKTDPKYQTEKTYA